MNVDSEGHLLIGGEVQPLHKALQTIKHQADLVRLNLKAAGAKADPAGKLPTTIIFRADRDATFGSLISLIKACQSNGFRKFALKAMNRSVTDRRTWRVGTQEHPEIRGARRSRSRPCWTWRSSS